MRVNFPAVEPLFWCCPTLEIDQCDAAGGDNLWSAMLACLLEAIAAGSHDRPEQMQVPGYWCKRTSTTNFWTRLSPAPKN